MEKKSEVFWGIIAFIVVIGAALAVLGLIYKNSSKDQLLSVAKDLAKKLPLDTGTTNK